MMTITTTIGYHDFIRSSKGYNIQSDTSEDEEPQKKIIETTENMTEEQKRNYDYIQELLNRIHAVEENPDVISDDEIENLTLTLQGKLLRIIETHEYYKLGGSKKYYSDFRLICATNRDLQDMVNKGAFRLDLFYRLDVLHLVLPPLRKHKDDISILAHKYLEPTRKRLSKAALDV